MEREARFRAVTLRVLDCLGVLVASFAFFHYIPFYPSSFSILAAASLAAFTYKFPPATFVLMFVLFIPGLVYQLGLAPVMVLTIAGIWLVVVLSVVETPGGVLRMCLAIVAAMLMLTSYFYLSIPLLIGVALMRLEGMRVGAPISVLVFLTIYLPLLATTGGNTAPGEPLPLLQQVSYVPKEALQTFHIPSLSALIQSGFGTNPRLLPILNLYTVTTLLIPLLVMLLAASIAAGAWLMPVPRWLQRQGVRVGILPEISPLLGMLVAGGMFLITLNVLAGPFRYTSQLDTSDNSLGYMLGVFLVGGVASLVGVWSGSRNQSARLKKRVTELLPEIQASYANLGSRVGSVTGSCPKLDVSQEEALIVRGEQESAVAFGTIEAMSLATLRQKQEAMEGLARDLARAHDEVSRKLCHQFDENRELYNYYVQQASEFGATMLSRLGGPSSAQLRLMDFEGVLGEQNNLNDRFRQFAESLAQTGDTLSLVVREEVDSDFMPSSLEIAHKFIDQGMHENAVETVLGEFRSIDLAVGSPAADLAVNVSSAIAALERSISGLVIPVFLAVGDLKEADEFRDFITRLNGIRAEGQGSRGLVGRMHTINQARSLASLMGAIVTKLRDRIASLEQQILSKVSPEHEWGRRSDFLPRTDAILAKLLGTSGSLNINSRMEAIDLAQEMIKEEAALVKSYFFTHEFLINYPNIEYLVTVKMADKGKVSSSDVPVKLDYAVKYLKLYSDKHNEQVYYDARTKSLRPKAQEKEPKPAKEEKG
ncbi:MAG: hypothetical protein V3S82_02650 [Dehalococcoidia bacterium]